MTYLRKILEELLKSKYDFRDNRVKEKQIDLAHQQILDLLPKKITEEDLGVGEDMDYAKHFNQAISEITHNLTKDI